MNKKPEKEDSLLVDRHEAARLLSVSPDHVARLSKRGLFPTVKLGASARYRRADILAAIERLAEGGE